MELFSEGGLRDEGGTVEPKSGNEVPSGSLKKEVADDIPIMISEGEFVFPADVVRYIGLNTLMKMRQDAKQGLKMMEKMGQVVHLWMTHAFKDLRVTLGVHLF